MSSSSLPSPIFRPVPPGPSQRSSRRRGRGQAASTEPSTRRGALSELACDSDRGAPPVRAPVSQRNPPSSPLRRSPRSRRSSPPRRNRPPPSFKVRHQKRTPCQRPATESCRCPPPTHRACRFPLPCRRGEGGRAGGGSDAEAEAERRGPGGPPARVACCF